jgi:hypothetical protein
MGRNGSICESSRWVGSPVVGVEAVRDLGRQPARQCARLSLGRDRALKRPSQARGIVPGAGTKETQHPIGDRRGAVGGSPLVSLWLAVSDKCDGPRPLSCGVGNEAPLLGLRHLAFRR